MILTQSYLSQSVFRLSALLRLSLTLTLRLFALSSHLALAYPPLA